MTAHGSSPLGSRSSLTATEPTASDGASKDDDVGAPSVSVEKPGPRAPLHLRSTFRIGFVGTLGVLVAYGLAQALLEAQSVLILIVVAFFVALGLHPLVRALSRRGVKRGLAVLVVLLGVVLVFGLAAFAVIPLLVEQITNLIRSAPEILRDTLRNPQVNALNERYQLIDRAREALTSGGVTSGLFGGLIGAGRLVLGAILSSFTVLILSLYFLVSLPAIKRAILRLSPASKRTRTGYLTEQIFLRISSYISGTFIVALIAGVLSYISLLIVGLSEYALALAVLVAILDIITLIGATLAAVVVVIIGFTQSPTIGIAALIFYAVYQQFENYVVQPRVFKKAVDVPGVLVVIAALIGGSLLGVVGALLSVPVAAITLLILREVAQPRLDAS
jgi:predicted PurR-regulated permease PerM